MGNDYAQDNEVENNQIGIYPCVYQLPREEELAQLDFIIDRTNTLVDLNRSYLSIEVQILNKDGSEIGDEVVAPVNNFGYALFENCDLYVCLLYTSPSPRDA